MNVESRGQVFTPSNIVDSMISMIRNEGSILEPSCGDGAFSNRLECISIEIDSEKCPKKSLNMDFFDYDISKKFKTIIGNPPYVRFQDIEKSTKSKLDMSLFDRRSNLYLFFIHKCILHLEDKGELIFITPREFLKNTSSIKLNEFIWDNGTITDLIDFGDKIIFKGFSPNVIIWRFEKGNFQRKTNIDGVFKKFKVVDGQVFFIENEYTERLSDYFYVKVGGVSGLDKIFVHKSGNINTVFSKTVNTNLTRKVIYNNPNNEHIIKNKKNLLQRKIKKFDDSNWWKWGRDFYLSNDKRIYVNSKTRIEKPFFTHPSKYFEGSVLGIFFKFNNMDEENVCYFFNSINWKELGFVCNNRYIFNQKSLENTLIPDNIKELL